MQNRRIEDSKSRLLDSEDPYRSFKRELLHQQAVDLASRESKRSRSKAKQQRSDAYSASDREISYRDIHNHSMSNLPSTIEKANRHVITH